MHHLNLDDDNYALANAEVTRHRAARRIVSDVLDIEADSQSYASRAKDRRLRDDITSRFYKVDCDNVKVGYDVSALTSARRHFASRSRSPQPPKHRAAEESDGGDENLQQLMARYLTYKEEDEEETRGRRRGRSDKRSRTLPLSASPSDRKSPVENGGATFKRRVAAYDDDHSPVYRSLPRSYDHHHSAAEGWIERKRLSRSPAAADHGEDSFRQWGEGPLVNRKKIMDNFSKACRSKLAADDPNWERRVNVTLDHIRQSLQDTEHIKNGYPPITIGNYSSLNKSLGSLHKLEPSAAYASPQRAASSNNPSADQAIREAKRYLARLENELGAGGDDDYNSAAYGRSTIITKRERGIPVVYLGDDDMYIPVINKSHGQSRAYGGYSSVPRLSRVTSHYDTTDLASSRGHGLGLGGVYTTISNAYAPHHTSKTYDLNGYLDELPRTTTTTTHHHVPNVYPSKPTTRSASSFDMREKPTYNFKPSEYAAAAREFRPTMSDTRRRIRDVICTTRHDPHYYDD